MDFFTPKYRRNPNAKVYSLYSGVASGTRTITRVVMKDPLADRLAATSNYGPGLPRGQSGEIAVLVIGGMETTLDEMEYILEARKQKRFVPRKTGGEIAEMCRLVAERRNDAIRYYRTNPSEMPKPKRKVVLHLPVGYRMMQTTEPGLQVRVRI